MSDKIDYKRIQAIVESAIDMKVRQIIDEEISEQIAPLRVDIDKVLKIVSDDRKEIPVIESKVDDHEVRIADLESNFATT
jgi:acyl-CoA hydrolase